MQKYLFREYDPRYQAFFTSEYSNLSNILGSLAVVEHVGSTAIPALGGKGIIDIAVGVAASKLNEAKQLLITAGYKFREQASYPDRLFFRVDYPDLDSTRRVHIHLTILDGRDWKEMLGFRDYMLQHPDTVEQYAELKKEGVKKALGDGVKYRQHKEVFIKNILRKIEE